MMSRRTLMGAGIAAASLTAVSGVRAAVPGTRRVETLLVDASLDLPPPLHTFVQQQKVSMRVSDIALDVGGHRELRQLFRHGAVVAGLSSGATLFCVEQVAKDAGWRITARRTHALAGQGEAACRADLATFLSGAGASGLAGGAYAPSRADNLLHIWVFERRRAKAERLTA